MKTLLSATVTLALILPAGAYGTENEYEDVIYLKDGSIIRGTIIERVPGETYKIEIAGGSVLVIEAVEVERIIREEKKVPGGPSDPTAGEQQGRRWFVSIQPTAGIIAGGEAEPIYGMEFTVGNRIKETYTAGLGFGYGRMDSLNIIPVYANNRLNFIKSQGTVVYPYLDVGYGFIIHDWGENGGGFLFGAGIGSNSVGKKVNFDFGVGFRSQGFAWGWSVNLLLFRGGISL